MTVNIEKMRFDIAKAIRKREDETRQWEAEQRTRDLDRTWEVRKFLISAMLAAAAAAAVGAGVGIGNLIWGHREPPPPPFTLQLAPGTVITAPPPSK